MLRNRSVGSKKFLMADHPPLSPTAKYTKTSSSSSLFPSPRLLIRSLSGKTLETEAAMSPTSILELKSLSSSDFNKRIGLGIIDSLDEEKSRRVLIGSQLKLQIPQFGIKTKDSLLKTVSSSNLAPDSPSPARTISGSLPIDMELSEDYTCVITHGPNPRMTHIFEDYIVESTGDDLPASAFLDFCHSCKKEIRHGSDTFMFRGEKAFCSEDCRSREIGF